MKFNTSYIIAALAAIFIVIWFVINSVTGESEAMVPQPIETTETAPLITVVVEPRQAEVHANSYVLFGRTEANREVAVKAKTAGLVVSTPIAEGSRVSRGTVLCRQDVDARQANVDQARSMLKTKEFDLKSTQTLVDKGYKSPIALSNAQAAVDGAQASVTQAEIELNNVNMRAPFSGIFDMQMAEIGDYLAPGQACGLLVELSPLLVSVELTETQIGAVKIGQSANVKLATGEQVTGKVRFIGSRANAATRTFRTQIELPNPKLALRGGVTATVSVKAGTALAQHIPSKILTLADNGSVGVRYLDANNIVRFANVTTIDEDATGVWVTGLPDDTRVIVEGQDFVIEGTEVDPRVMDNAPK